MHRSDADHNNNNNNYYYYICTEVKLTTHVSMCFQGVRTDFTFTFTFTLPNSTVLYTELYAW